jgi:hypothetical protein
LKRSRKRKKKLAKEKEKKKEVKKKKKKKKESDDDASEDEFKNIDKECDKLLDEARKRAASTIREYSYTDNSAVLLNVSISDYSVIGQFLRTASLLLQINI